MQSQQPAIAREQAEMETGQRHNVPDYLQVQPGQPALEPEQLQVESGQPAIEA